MSQLKKIESVDEAQPAAIPHEINEQIAKVLQRALEPVARVMLLKEKEYLTEKEVGELFPISPATLRTLRSRGIGPGYYKYHTKVVYSRKEISSYFQKQLVKQGLGLFPDQEF